MPDVEAGAGAGVGVDVGGSSTGAGDAGSTETIETVGAGDGGVEDGGAGDGARGSTGDGGAGEGGDTTGDGRTLPKDVQQHLIELRTTNPQLAKTLRSAFFERAELRKSFPGGVQEAIAAKTFVDKVGGEEGLQAIEAERGEWAALDDLYSKGDPRFIENIADSDPEAFARMAPAVLSQLNKIDRETYSHLMAKVVVNTLQRSPIDEIYQTLAQSTDAATKGLASKLAEWFNNLSELASKQPEKKIDPERQKLETEKQNFERQQREHFVTTTRDELTSWSAAEYGKELDTLLGTRKLDKEDRELLLTNIDNRIGARIPKHPLFPRYKTALQARDGKTAKQLAQKIISDGLKKDVKTVYDAMFRIGGAKPQAAKPQQTQQQPSTRTGPTTVKVGKAPESREIDYRRTSNDMIFKNQAYLKGKKELVTW